MNEFTTQITQTILTTQTVLLSTVLPRLVIEHISNIRKLKANFSGREKEGHFHYNFFFESFKMSTHMIYLHDSHKIPAL